MVYCMLFVYDENKKKLYISINNWSRINFNPKQLYILQYEFSQLNRSPTLNHLNTSQLKDSNNNQLKEEEKNTFVNYFIKFTNEF